MLKPPYSVVLTGACGGIGRAIAQALAAQARQLILVGRDPGHLEDLKRELNSSAIHLVCGDLLDPNTRLALHAKAASVGGINVLINNAGTSAFSSFANQSPDSIQRVMDVNLTAPMLLTQTLLPILQRQPQAQVINIGSAFGSIGFPGFSSYCASKFGLRGFTQALRRELADTPVRVRLFSPRATRTSINSDAVDQLNAALNTTVDSPEFVAQKFIEFLSGRANDYQVGGTERFFAKLNQLLPGLPDQALRKQLPTIKKYFNR